MRVKSHPPAREPRSPEATPLVPPSVAAAQVASHGSVEATRLDAASPALPGALPDVAPRPATLHQPQPGKLAQLNATSWSPDQLRATLVNDIKVGFALLRELPPAVTFFGGARIKPDDPYYALAMEMGAHLAHAGVPPRTGAGPGIMEAVPEGHHRALGTLRALAATSRLVPMGVGALGSNLPGAFAPVIDGFASHASVPARETQGFNIKLPHEQKLAASIDRHAEIAEFMFRKVVLYENARGLVTFPGGYGTLDELFQVWTLHGQGKHNDPMALAGKAYWQPLLDALERTAVSDRPLVDRALFQALHVGDTAAEVLQFVAARKDVRGFESDPDALATRYTREISAAMATLERLPPAVAFVGAENLASDDPALAVAQEAARLLAQAGTALRVGSGAKVAQAVVAGARTADPAASLQGMALASSPGAAQLPGVTLEQSVSEYAIHVELMKRNTQAFVALPGDLTTLHQLFALLTEIQCGKVPPQPVVLVGKSYWQPIFDAIKQTMLSGERQTIAPSDLDLVVITDDPKEVARMALNHVGPAATGAAVG